MNETLLAVCDLVAMICLVLGALLCLLAAIGLLRFPDVLSRMHAAAKPQVLGVLLVLLAVALSLRSLPVLGSLFLVGTFQLMTAPVASQMMSRAAVRTGQVDLTRQGADTDD